MSERKNKTARFVAAEVLEQFDPKHNYAGAILNRVLPETEQKQRATDLVFGSIRNRVAIDAVINTFSGCPLERIQRKLLNIIRIGCYELIYSPATVDYSIVNEAAENAKAIAGKKQVGFVNALLHQIIRHISERQIELSKADAKRTLVQTAVTGCQFDADFLPDSKTNPVEYLSAVFSLPKWLVTNWLAEFGAESAGKICLAQNRRPSIYIRPNKLKTTAQQLIEKFEKEGIELEKVPDRSVMLVKNPRSVSKLPGYEEGLFVVQDISASQPVEILNPQSGWEVLDLCAAPGIKTTQLAEVTGDSAKITATDIDERRLKKVQENIDRLGIKSVEILPYDRLPNSKFDCVLLDVPCSNSGVLAKRIEVRYRISPQAITELADTQNGLLDKAAGLLKPHGKICYSTCSIQRQENTDVVKGFLERHPEFELENEQLVLPSAEAFDHDGGYTAIINRL
jgi:16S rRNA (cytosine967-C5)-methyltransferase